MQTAKSDPQPAPQTTDSSKKFWIYTNFDCNLSCTYCVAESTPRSPRRAIPLETAVQLVDEAVDLGFESVYFTGGEPFVLEEIYAMLDYAVRRLSTTVLTNGMLLHGKRLEKLKAIPRDNLTMQVSLDGSCPQQHDPFRGTGSWVKTVDGINQLLENGFKMRLSTTETAANNNHLDEICTFHQQLGIPEEDHIIRPLARRGFSQEGIQVSKESLIPELTINVDGVFWHPLSTDPDMLVQTQIFPLAEALNQIQVELYTLNSSQAEMNAFQ